MRIHPRASADERAAYQRAVKRGDVAPMALVALPPVVYRHAGKRSVVPRIACPYCGQTWLVHGRTTAGASRHVAACGRDAWILARRASVKGGDDG